MSKLIIIRGNLGSGKTSVAKELGKKFGADTMRISHDLTRKEMILDRDKETLPLLKEFLKFSSKNVKTTILEGLLDSEQYLPLFKNAIRRFGENIFAYYYDLPFEETLMRHETKPDKSNFSEEDLRRFWKEKDFIGIIPEKIITKDMSLSETVDMIFNDVSEK